MLRIKSINGISGCRLMLESQSTAVVPQLERGLVAMETAASRFHSNTKANLLNSDEFRGTA